MKIKKILSQHRRDFTAIFDCEHCGFSDERGGYDDDHFHLTVVPNWPCPSCNKVAGGDYRPLRTKYAAGEIV